MSAVEIIQGFIKNELLHKESLIDLTPDFLLLDGGVIDSISLQRLVGYVEDEFEITITDEYMEPAYFASIRSIAKLIEDIRLQGDQA